jgi:hypothetical protein
MKPVAYIVVEGESDRLILQKLLPPRILPEVKILAAGGRSSAYSMATTLVNTRRVPVVLVVDADSIQPSQIEERAEFVQGLMRRAALETPFLVIVVVPEMEAVLLGNRAYLEGFAGRNFTDFEWNAAQRDPKGFLKEIQFDHSKIASVEFSSSSAAHPVLRQIVDFIEKLHLAHAA